MTKKNERMDILALAEKLTGISYQEIINTAYKGTDFDSHKIMERVYMYEQDGNMQLRVRLFAAYLVLDWKKKHGDFTLWEYYENE